VHSERVNTKESISRRIRPKVSHSTAKAVTENAMKLVSRASRNAEELPGFIAETVSGLCSCACPAVVVMQDRWTSS